MKTPNILKWSESHSVVSNSLRSHGLYCPWNSLGQNTGVGNLSLLQGIFPTQGSNPGLLHCRRILYQLSHKVTLRIKEWVAYPFYSGFSQPRNPTGSPALQADSLPTELWTLTIIHVKLWFASVSAQAMGGLFVCFFPDLRFKWAFGQDKVLWNQTSTRKLIHFTILKECIDFIGQSFSASALLTFSHSVVSDSWRPHELQHTRPSCPSPTPRVLLYWLCQSLWLCGSQ